MLSTTHQRERKGWYVRMRISLSGPLVSVNVHPLGCAGLMGVFRRYERIIDRY